MLHAHFEGTLGAAEYKRHIAHRFTLPAGCARMDVQLRFAPLTVDGLKNMLSLTVFDPAGFRGAGHRSGDLHTVSIGPGAATPGYIPGPLPAGEWNAEVDTHLIMPGPPVHYWLDVSAVDGVAEVVATGGQVSARPAPPASRSAAGWHAATAWTSSS